MNIHKFKFTPRVTTQSDVIYIALASSLPYTLPSPRLNYLIANLIP